MAFSQEELDMIAAIAAKAAAAAIQGVAAASPAAPVAAPAEAEGEDAEDEEAARRSVAEQEAKIAALGEAVEEIIPQIMQPRHLEVWRFMMASRQLTAPELLRQIIRAEVARVTPDFREWRGGGGSSSRNIEALTERLPVRK